jgi:hypothetical protein
MGANAQTTVPTFTAGQVLTAAQQNASARTGVPVFADTTARDAAFGGTGEKTLAEGQLCYLEDTNKVQYYDGAAWANLGSVTNVEAFTASGTWTVPAGVTYAIAHILGGGGGANAGGVAAGNGGTSSVAFAGGTISAAGGNGASVGTALAFANPNRANNGGESGEVAVQQGGGYAFSAVGANGAYVVAGGAVTPAASITVTVGAGGTAVGGCVGGSGYVWIEYQV